MEGLNYGLTAFTQRALIELDKQNNSRRHRASNAETAVRLVRRASTSFSAPLHSPNSSTKPPRTLSPLSRASPTPAPAASVTPVKSVEAAAGHTSGIVAASADRVTQHGAATLGLRGPTVIPVAVADTIHHQHHLKKKQDKIQQLERERLEAAEIAKQEAIRIEIVREKRLQRQFRHSISHYRQIESDLTTERRRLNEQRNWFLRQGYVRRVDPTLSQNEADKMLTEIGSRVHLVARCVVEDLSALEGISPPAVGFTEHNPTALQGRVVGDGSHPETVRVVFPLSETPEPQEVVASCLRRVSEVDSPSAPLVLCGNGIALELQKVDVFVEIIGALAHVTHRTQWCVPATVGFSGQNLLALIPLAPQAIFLGASVDIGQAKLRTLVLAEYNFQQQLQACAHRRSARLQKRARVGGITPQMTPREAAIAEGGPATSPSEESQTMVYSPEERDFFAPQAASSKERGSVAPTSPIFGGVAGLATSFGSTSSARDGVWQDPFQCCNGCDLSNAVVVPLKEADAGEAVTMEVRYALDATVATHSSGGPPTFAFRIPCHVPEHFLPRDGKQFDSISTLSIVVGGANAKGMTLWSQPPTRPGKATAFGAGQRPNYSLNIKNGVWNNHDCVVHFAPEKTDEMGIAAFLETNPSAPRTDSFMVVVSPPLTVADGGYRRLVGLLFQLDTLSSDEHTLEDVVATARALVGNLLPSDYVACAVVLGGKLWRVHVEDSDDSSDALLLQPVQSVDVLADRVAHVIEAVAHGNAPAPSIGDALVVGPDDFCTSFAAVLAVLTTLRHPAHLPHHLQQQRDHDLQRDVVRELIFVGSRDMPRTAQDALAASATASAGVRIHACFGGAPRSSTALMWEGLASRSHGIFTAAPFAAPSFRLQLMLAFGARLTRCIATDVEIAFGHATSTEFFGSVGDLYAGTLLVVCGRCEYNASSDSPTEQLSVSGKMTKGRALKRRQLCSKISFPLTRMLRPRYLAHHLSHRYVAGLGGPLRENTPLELGDIVDEAVRYGVPLAVPVDVAAQVQRTRAAAAGAPVAGRLSTGSDDSGGNDSGGGGIRWGATCSSACCCLFLQKAADYAGGARFPPFFSVPSPGLVPSGGARTWCESALRRLERDMIDVGCFARLAPPVDATAGAASASPFVRPFVDWLLRAGDTYDVAVDGLVDAASDVRGAVESEEWHDYLDLLHQFHEQRIALLLAAVKLAQALADVEESHRQGYNEIVAGESGARQRFMDSTGSLRNVIDRVNIFAREGRRRMAYEEEAARGCIVSDQNRLATAIRFVIYGTKASLADVQTVIDTVEYFMDDRETIEFLACVFCVWSDRPARAEVIGLQGGIVEVKRLLQVHTRNENIVSWLLPSIVNFAQIRTNHGKLESSNIALEVMHALALHHVSVSVQIKGIRCLATLANLTQNFRQSIILSSHGLSLVLKTFGRFLHDLSFATHVFSFFRIVSQEATSHRQIAECALRTMTSAVLVRHRGSAQLLNLYFLVVSRLASSRALRLLLVLSGLPAAVAVWALRSAATPDAVRVEALTCVERIVGNVGDYPASALCFALHQPLEGMLRSFDQRITDTALVERASRLLQRLTLSPCKGKVDCDEILRPLWKPTSSLSFRGVVPPEAAGLHAPYYGAVFHALFAIAGMQEECFVRMFSRVDLAQYLDDGCSTGATLATEASYSDHDMWALFEAVLALQLQDVLVNTFAVHPRMLRCLGFSTDDDLHGTIFALPPGPSIAKALHDAERVHQPIPWSAWMETAFLLFDVAASFASAGTIHGELLLTNIFADVTLGNAWDIVVGPASALTLQIAQQFPATQTLHNVQELVALASRTAEDELVGIQWVLADFLNAGRPSFECFDAIYAMVPSEIAPVIFSRIGPDADLLGTHGMSAAETRDAVAHWMAMPHANAFLTQAVPFPRLELR